MSALPLRPLTWLALLSLSAGGLVYGFSRGLARPDRPIPLAAPQVITALSQPEAKPTGVGWIALSSLVLTASTLEWRRSRQDRQHLELRPRPVGLASPPRILGHTPVVAPLQRYRLCRLRGSDRQQYLALRVGKDYYTFYRQRSTLQQATRLVEQWQQRGYAALATHDITQEQSIYAVWVRGLYLPSAFHSG